MERLKELLTAEGITDYSDLEYLEDKVETWIDIGIITEEEGENFIKLLRGL